MAGKSRAGKTQGTFKLFLGYAPGVGKTYNMLSEPSASRSREDIVIVSSRPRPPRTAELAANSRPFSKEGRIQSVLFDEMDVDAIIAVIPDRSGRRTRHTTSKQQHRKRYEDVLDISPPKSMCSPP